MDKQNSSRSNMVRITLTLCRDNKNITDTIKAFSPVLKAIETKLSLIDQLNMFASSTTTGVTTDTNVLRKTMSDTTLKCANALAAYASAKNNNTLFDKTNLPESKLSRLKKDEIDDVAQNIHDLSVKHLKHVKSYGIDLTDIKDLKTSVTLYRSAMQDPRQAIINSSQAKKQIKEMLDDIISELLKNQVDKMVTTLRKDNPDFYNTYKQARKTIEIGTRSDSAPETPPIQPPPSDSATKP